MLALRMVCRARRALMVVAAAALPATLWAANGDTAQGQRIFGQCAPCHSLEPDKNLTGPSLAGLWGRKAGSLPSFTRYSPALKGSGITWNDDTLNQWVADPERLVPGNNMTFPGIKDAAARGNFLAYLKQATAPGAAPQTAQMGGGMGGMMNNGVPNLKNLDPGDRVQSVTYCRDTYDVTLADGSKKQFFERNLRFKTDSGEDGPSAGAPALVPAGMMGDRADVIFAQPQEFSQFVSSRCANSN